MDLGGILAVPHMASWDIGASVAGVLGYNLAAVVDRVPGSLNEAVIEKRAASLDLLDYFDFDVERAGEADLLGAVRYRANASIAGRLFEQLLIDIGIDQAHFEPAEELTTPDLLGFAGIEPARIPAAPLEQHLAEKLHAYTRRYGRGHASSRPKDLIDMVLISELADFQAQRLCQVVEGVFSTRTTHELPTRFPPPSSQWARPYRIWPPKWGSIQIRGMDTGK